MRSEQRVGLSSRTSDVMEEGCFFRGTKEKRIEVRGRTSNPKTAAACIHLWLRQCWNLVGIPRSLEDSLLICLVSRARFSGRENEKEKKKKKDGGPNLRNVPALCSSVSLEESRVLISHTGRLGREFICQGERMFEQLETCSDHQETSSFSIREEKKKKYTHTHINVDVDMLKNIQ